ncbi:MAG: septum formation family protein [Acidimicrobiia bacterium]
MPAHVTRCPNCRARVDPTFTTHCPECGTSITPEVASMIVPGADATPPVGSGAGRSKRWIAVSMAVALLGIVAANVLVSSGQVDRSDGGASVESGPVDAFDLAVGDCIEWPSSDETYQFEEIEVLPCDQPHDAEVYALASHPLGPGAGYPGDDVVGDWSVDTCHRAFPGYVGRSYEGAEDLEFTFFAPTEAGWNSQDDRVVQCLVFRVDEAKISGSVSPRG